LAAKNADLELADEDKAFAARKESFDELGKARDWLYLVGETAAKKLRERAERRGDTLLQEDTFRHLKSAKRYFGMAEAKSKEQALQDKALRLAQTHEKQGEIAQARDFYHLAGAGAKGDELEKRAEAQHEKSEEKRQKQFKQEQGDLEKELGM
jgi:D-alanyl-D-alanine dipeptidase